MFEWKVFSALVMALAFAPGTVFLGLSYDQLGCSCFVSLGFHDPDSWDFQG